MMSCGSAELLLRSAGRLGFGWPPLGLLRADPVISGAPFGVSSEMLRISNDFFELAFSDSGIEDGIACSITGGNDDALSRSGNCVEKDAATGALGCVPTW